MSKNLKVVYAIEVEQLLFRVPGMSRDLNGACPYKDIGAVRHIS